MRTDQHVTSASAPGPMSTTTATASTSRRQRRSGTNAISRLRVRGHGPATQRPGGGRRTGEQIAELVATAAAGDASAWDELVREFSGLVRSIARCHRLSDADAADAAQATWLLLFQHLDRIKEQARVGAWLATTARRECLRVLRGTHRYVALEDESDYVETDDAAADTALLAEERDRALRRCFSRLRATDQQLLTLLMSDEQLAYSEISAALAIPVGSIGPTRSRALDRLRVELASDGTLGLLSA
jgi:RNA polymerase sigma factor (sigma-70 family)